MMKIYCLLHTREKFTCKTKKANIWYSTQGGKTKKAQQ
jgi:hypothetical protein